MCQHVLSPSDENNDVTTTSVVVFDNQDNYNYQDPLENLDKDTPDKKCIITSRGCRNKHIKNRKHKRVVFSPSNRYVKIPRIRYKHGRPKQIVVNPKQNEDRMLGIRNSS